MKHYSFKYQQMGFAALLAVLVVGLAAAALVFSRVANVRGAQDAGLMLNKTTQTEARVWKAADAIRQALGDAVPGYVAGLVPGATLPVSISGLGNTSLVATVVSNTVVNGSNELTLRIVATDAANPSQSTNSSALNVVYLVTPNPPCTPGQTVAGVICPGPPDHYNIVIRGNLRNDGTLNFIGGAGAILVDGTAQLGGTGTDLDTLCATGDVTVESNWTVKNVCTDGKLFVTGSASIETASSMGDASMNSSGTIGKLNSNSDVSVSNGVVTTLQTKKNVVVSAPGVVRSTEAEKNVTWTSDRAANSIANNGNVTSYAAALNTTSISSRGSVTLSGRVGSLKAMGSVTLNSSALNNGVAQQLLSNGDFSYISGKTFVNDGEVAGDITPPLVENMSPIVNVRRRPGEVVVNVPPVIVSPVREISQQLYAIDANSLRSSANYIFTVDSQNRMMVQVQNVSGIVDGNYYLGAFAPSGSDATTGYDYLCQSVAPVGGIQFCQTPATRAMTRTICDGALSGDQKAACFGYDPLTKTWSLTTAIIASGVVWFDGNLAFRGAGNYTNTFIATGNISVEGRPILTSVNFASHIGTCTTRQSRADSKSPLAPSTLIYGLFPTNFCEGGRMKSPPINPLGNPVLVAGSFNGGNFSGGNITTENNTIFFGSVLAGNAFSIGGCASLPAKDCVVTIYGILIASGQASSTSTNLLQGRVNFDNSSDYPSTFNPQTVPCMSSLCQAQQASFAQTGRAQAQVAAAGTPVPPDPCVVGCTAGLVSQVRVYWSAYD